MGRHPSVRDSDIIEVLRERGCLQKEELYRELRKRGYGIARVTYFKLLKNLESEKKVLIKQRGRQHYVCLPIEDIAREVPRKLIDLILFLWKKFYKVCEYGSSEKMNEIRKLKEEVNERLLKMHLISEKDIRKMEVKLEERRRKLIYAQYR